MNSEPIHLLCPASQRLMVEPVYGPCGHVFDRSLFDEQSQVECPVCLEKVSSSQVVVDQATKMELEEFQRKKKKPAVFSMLMSHLRKPKKKRREKSRLSVTRQISLSSSGMAPLFEDEGPESNVVPVWAELRPILDVCPIFQVDRNKFRVGRDPTSHAQICISEVSSKHLTIVRTKRADGLFQVHLEDHSTNGTYVNGAPIGRGNKRAIFHGMELCLSRKFTAKRGLPRPLAFVDWVFGSQGQKQQLDILRSFESFEELIQSTFESLEKRGVKGSTRSQFLEAVKIWREEHMFPAFILVLKQPQLYAQSEKTEVGLEIALNQLQLDDSVLRQLQARYTAIEQDVIQIVLNYEQVLGGEDLYSRCVLKLDDLQRQRTETSTYVLCQGLDGKQWYAPVSKVCKKNAWQE